MRFLTIFFLSIFLIGPVHAYVIGQLDSGIYDPSRPTHILIAGYPGKVYDEFYFSAYTRARRYKELFPEHQVIMLEAVRSPLGTQEDKFRRGGFKILVSNRSSLRASRLLPYLLKFNDVLSLDILSHSSAHNGAGIESGDSGRLGIFTSNVGSLKQIFAPDGYATFGGCNSGFIQAPRLSQSWGVPVSGALSGTDFEHLYSDLFWYLTSRGTHPPISRAKINTVSYNVPASCSLGACVRMNPDNHPYNGYWGNYSGGGLPFYKWFCPDNLEAYDCYRIMAKSLLSYPSLSPLALDSSEEDFKLVLKDYLCPTNNSGSLRDACFNTIEQRHQSDDWVYNPFNGNMLNCDTAGCLFNFRCRGGTTHPRRHGCRVTAPENRTPTTLVEEYDRFLKGFRLL